MGDENGDAATGAAIPCGCGIALEERMLGLGIERGGRLVEDQQQWLIAHEAAGQRQLLPLAEG